jgi:very-short-patch-repair endonuclease
MLSGPKRTIRRARTLRREMSLPEVLLWQVLRKRPAALKFRRQQAAGPYVVDFFCHEAALVLEVDGESHNRGNQPQIDAERDEYLRRNGYKVLRVAAVDVLSDLDSVVRQIIASAAVESPLHHPSDGPPPLEGRI